MAEMPINLPLEGSSVQFWKADGTPGTRLDLASVDGLALQDYETKKRKVVLHFRFPPGSKASAFTAELDPKQMVDLMAQVETAMKNPEISNCPHPKYHQTEYGNRDGDRVCDVCGDEFWKG